MDAIILAGGFAKRMWPLTKNKPKQLLDIAGKPMLNYVINSLHNLNLNRIIISVNNFFAPQFQDYLNSQINNTNIELAKLYGIADLKGNRIVDFVEKPASPPSTLAATAYWLLSKEGIDNFFSYIDEGGDRDAMGNFLTWNVKKTSVFSVSFNGNWYDIGSLDSYYQAQKWIERRP